MSREIHRMRLPRLVHGVVARGREPERLAVHDEVPVEIRRLEPDRTHAAWASEGGGKTQGLAADGVPYLPLDHGRPGTPDTFASLWEGLAERIASEAGIGERRTGWTQQPIADWATELPGASRRRGLVAGEAIRFRETFDDGRAAQAALARRIGARLALFGGHLYHRASLPRIRVSCDDRDVHLFDTQPRFPLDAAEGEPLGHEDFRLDRRDDALAFAEAARDRLGLRDSGATSGRLRILDPGALAACYDRAGPESELATLAVADGVRRTLSPIVGELPDDWIRRYLGLRTELLARDAAGLRAWLEEADALLAALGGHRVGEPAERARTAAAALAPVLLRHRVIDLPRLFLQDGDAAALDALAPG